MKRSVIAAFAALALAASARVTPISEGRLYTDLDANGHTITNLPDGFFPTNTYTKAEADARIVALAPVPGNYGVVSNAAVNAAPKYKSKFNCQWVYYDGIRHLLSGGEPWEDAIAMWGHSHLPRLSNCALEYLGAGVWRFHTGSATPEPDYKVVTNSEDAVVLDFGGNYLLTKTNEVQSAVVYSDELHPAISNVVTKAYVESLGIASEESDPVWSEEKSKYAKHEDVPEWPVQLITTNAPLIFADGQDTNVTSIALQAQPTNYTSLSFLHPVSYYLPNRFSLFELGNDYQIVGSQWFQVGRYLYAQNPENIVFVGSGRHRSLQDYLDACAPETLADLLSCYVPTNGGGRIHGDLEIDGRLTAGELITITNSDIHAKGFQVVNKVLTADGLTASNGMVRLNCARFVLGFGTPRMHLETNTLSAITYGGTWDNPEGTMQGLLRSTCQDLLAGNTSYQSIEDRDPYVRYNNVKKSFFDWDLKSLPVNAGPLKHFDLQTGKTHYFTDADVGREGIELRFYTNTHVRVVYDFETAPPSSVYVRCNDSADGRATILSNGSELLYPTAGQRTLFEIEPLSNGTFMVKETALTFMDNVGSWEEANYGAQEEEP